MLHAIDILHRALSIDSTDARLWAAFSNAVMSLAVLGVPNVQEAIMAARRAAERAVALDENLPEGHASLGILLEIYMRDWQGAGREFHKSLALEPRIAMSTAHGGGG